MRWMAATALCVWTTGCVQAVDDHCANQDDPILYCGQHHSLGACSKCVGSNNGCVPDTTVVEPHCQPAGATSVAEDSGTTSGATQASSDGEDTMSTTLSTTITSETTAGESEDSTGESESGGPIEPGCGNGVLEKSIGENCDEGVQPDTTCEDVGLVGGNISCYPPGSELECKYDLTGCMGAMQCNNGTIEGTEQCDMDDLNDADCVSISANFIGGDLGCSNMCQFDTSGCTQCLNNNAMCTGMGQCCPGLSCNLLTHRCFIL